MAQDILSLWQQFDKVAHAYVSPIKSKKQYEETIALMEILWDELVSNPHSAYGSLFQIVSDNLHKYEQTIHALPDATPRQVLNYLIEEHGLTQKDVEEATGIYQSKLSQILKGKRKLTTDQVKVLAAFFNISPETLI